MERRAIQRALAHFGADTKGKQDAAKALGIGIATLYRKLKALEDFEQVQGLNGIK